MTGELFPTSSAMTVEPLHSIHININMAKHAINFLRGWPSPSLLPAHLLAGAAQRLLTNPTVFVPALQYGPDEGYRPLRDGLAAWLGRHYSVDPDPERICITGGASQNVANVLQSYTDPVFTRAVWLVAPVFHLACPIFEDSGFRGRLHAAPEDEDGIDVEVLEAKLKAFEELESKKGNRGEPYKNPGPLRKLYRHVIYAVPSCGNPSGKTMSLKRREGLVRLARKYDALIIADDVYDFLQWRIPSEPGALGIPEGGFGNVVSNGSFSKIAGPGVRTGWAEGTRAFAFGLAQTASSKSGGAPSQLCAAMLSDLVHSGELQTHIDQVIRPSLQRRHKLMLDTLRQHLVPLGAEVRHGSLLGADIYGGYFVWIAHNLGVSSDVISKAAQEEENMIIGGGNMFAVKGDDSVRFDNEIRLTFAWLEEQDIVDGVERLAALFQRIKANPEQYKATVGKTAQDQGRLVDSFK
uniref:Aminotransferase class I/classII large domain-containing protein n=1 Tax=Bionectria ochroleuca TaxID=29856 RepID=A0A8H7TMR1_BIOOC